MSTRKDTAGPVPPQGPGRWPRRTLVAGGTALVLALGATGGAVALRSDRADTVSGRSQTDGAAPRPSADSLRTPAPGTPGTPPGGTTPGASPSAALSAVGVWRDEVLKAYQPLATSSFSAVQTIAEWNLGRASAADVAVRVRSTLTSSRETTTALEAKAPLPGTEQALLQYRAAADLYVQSMQIVLTAAGLPAGPLQTQMRRSSARVRDLGDRTFDQAAVALAPLLPAAPDLDGVEVRKPPEVPDYASIELGVGPPLEPSEEPAGEARTYQDTRPEQPVRDWERAVRALDVPTPAQLATLLSGSDPGAAGAGARRLVAAADALYALPDPRGRRLDSTQLQLGLLVDADALRCAQAATLTSGKARTELRAAAAGLHEVATSLRSGPPTGR